MCVYVCICVCMCVYWLVAGTHSEAAHQLLCCFLQHLARLTFTLLLQLLLRLNTHTHTHTHTHRQGQRSSSSSSSYSHFNKLVLVMHSSSWPQISLYCSFHTSFLHCWQISWDPEWPRTSPAEPWNHKPTDWRCVHWQRVHISCIKHEENIQHVPHPDSEQVFSLKCVHTGKVAE